MIYLQYRFKKCIAKLLGQVEIVTERRLPVSQVKGHYPVLHCASLLRTICCVISARSQHAHG